MQPKRLAFVLSVLLIVMGLGCSRAASAGRFRHDPAGATSAALAARSAGAELARLERIAGEHVTSFCTSNGCPGGTVAFVLRDGRFGRAAAGVSRRGKERAMRPSDRMFSGSIGKTYVATVMLELAAEQNIDLDTKIAKWFGGESWFGRLPNGADVTLRMLLNHSSGIPEHIDSPAMQERVKAEPQRTWRPEELVAYILDAEPLFTAGTGWSYADTNYILVGMIIERITGRTYYDLLAERILRPLHMDETTPAVRPELAGLVSGYTSADNIFGLRVKVAYDERYGINPQLEWTGGGLVSTSGDLARWAWLLYGGRVLADESLQSMLTGVPTGRIAEEVYGLGVFIRPSAHGTVLGHAGWVPGYVSLMAYYPEQGVAIALQINSDVGMKGAMLAKLIDRVADGLFAEVAAPGNK